ncbi:hypothetical protein F4778DRAFT_765620 [Xylariomycetidae sp. FL2044]|nr:hypothetical protein F4778DRAFT_765620 [Xylariomycetidae sp. FL2044]
MPSVPFNAKIANQDTWLPRGGTVDGQAPVFGKKRKTVSFCEWVSIQLKRRYLNRRCQ